MTDSAGWSDIRLKDLFTSVRNGAWGNDPEVDTVTFCARGTDFDRVTSRISPTNMPRRSFEPNILRQHELKPGDLVLEKSGGSADQPVGSVALFDLPTRAVCSNFNARLQVDSNANPRFVCYLMNSLYWSGFTRKFIKQTTGIQNLDASELLAQHCLLPPLKEQRRIVDFLDAETARIDRITQSKRQMIALLEERVQAVINQITPGVMARGIDGRPVGITGMPSVRLGALAVVEPGFAMDPRWKTDADSVTAPYLRVANVQDGSLALNDVKEVTLPKIVAARCTLRPGDVLMTEGGDPDKLGRGTVWTGDLNPCLHQNAIFAVRPDARLLPEYLALVTRTGYARAYFEMTATKSTGIAHTSSTKITGFRIPMRPTDEQRAIVHSIHDALAHVEALRLPAQRQVELLSERRQALITAAVTGQIDVTTAGGVAA